MSEQNKQRKFTKTLMFKVIFGLVVLVLLGFIYNFIVAEDDPPMTMEEQEEVQKRNADIDTIDIVGNYLWPDMKPSRQDMMTEEEKNAETVKDKERKEEKAKPSAEEVHGDRHEAPIAAPAPDIAPSAELPAKQTAPSIEKLAAPKIEKIE